MPWKEYGRYGSVGIELILSMAVGYYGGRWVDARVGAHGWITLAGFLAGYTGLTSDAYELDLRQYVAWCDDHDLDLFPGPPG